MKLVAIHFQKPCSWLPFLNSNISSGAVEEYANVDKDKDYADIEEEVAAVDLLRQGDIVGRSLERRSA